MSRSINFYLVAITLLFYIQTFSQTPPITWGKIPRADLKSTSYPLDSNAAAVILCDYGETTINDYLNLEFRKHLRIKILAKSGFYWGTHTIIIDGESESIDDIMGVTYSLNNDSEIVEKMLDEEDIFEEEIDDYFKMIRFTMPGLHPGCVIDIMYTIEIENLLLIRDWTFQHDIPVRWSEYRTIIPEYISYTAVTRAYETWEVYEDSEVTRTFKDRASRLLGTTTPKCKMNRWAVKNAPALNDAPYITTIDDYANKVELQLSGYDLVGVERKHILNDWDVWVTALLESEIFIKMLEMSDNVSELAEVIIEGLTIPEQRMEAIYNWVKNTIVWNGAQRVYPSLELDEIIEYRKGNNADITFLLLSLLKSIEIRGDPVILSTRENGEIQTLYQIVSQFNYMLAKVKIGSKSYHLDATDPLRPFDLIPKKILNVKGLVIKPGGGKPEWITFNTDKKNYNSTHIIATLHEDGSLDGIIRNTYSEYMSLSLRKILKDKEEKDFAIEMIGAEEQGLQIDSLKVISKDSIHLPLKLDVKVSTSSYSQTNGEFIYLNPQLVHRLTSNPLKSDIRKYPVDYGYKRGDIMVINLTIPEGYEVIEKLQNSAIQMKYSLKYSRNMAVDKNLIELFYRLDINATKVKPEYYITLKNFYAKMIDLQSEQLVIGPVANEQNKIPINKSK